MSGKAILAALARNVRQKRHARALTLKELAQQAGVSQRFLTSLEGGNANVSVLKLAQIAAALRTTPAALLTDASSRREPIAPTGSSAAAHVALIGLRGAGKTTIGSHAAMRLAVDFVELDEVVVERAGIDLETLFEIHGRDYYRRLEAEALADVLSRGRNSIIATGGSIVTHHGNYELLRSRCSTVFLSASAEDHWTRVVAQGDVRPMANRNDAMDELRAILRARRALYELADVTVDTSSLGLERSTSAVVKVARKAAAWTGAVD